MAVLARIWAFLVDVLGIPNIKDEQAVKLLFKRFLDTAARVVAWIPGKADDEFVAMLDRIVAVPEAWDALYKYLVQRLSAAPTAPPLEDLATALRQATPEFEFNKIMDFLRKLLELISTFFGQ